MSRKTLRKTAIEWTDYSWNPIRARNLQTGTLGWHCEPKWFVDFILGVEAGKAELNRRTTSEAWRSSFALEPSLNRTRQTRADTARNRSCKLPKASECLASMSRSWSIAIAM